MSWGQNFLLSEHNNYIMMVYAIDHHYIIDKGLTKYPTFQEYIYSVKWGISVIYLEPVFVSLQM